MSTISEEANQDEEEDISFCDDWDILHEEDFQTEEEESQARLQLAKAEEALMKAYFTSAEAKMEEDQELERMMHEELDRIKKIGRRNFHPPR